MVVEYSGTKGKVVEAYAPNELDSGGLGPCISIGAIFRPNKGGMMVHKAPGGEFFPDIINNFFNKIEERVWVKNGLGLWVAGGRFSGMVYDSFIKEGRDTAESIIDERGLRRYVEKISWCPAERGQSLRLILEKNIAQIREF